MKLLIARPSQSSGGGNNFISNLADALTSADVDVTLTDGQTEPDVHRGLASLGQAASKTPIVWPGAVCLRVPRATSIFWPLNVEPLEPLAYRLRDAHPRSALRLAALRRRLRGSAKNADATVFGSQHAQRLYQGAMPALQDLPSTVISGGARSLGAAIEVVDPPSWPGSPLRLLYVSHLYPYKGGLELLEAMARVLERSTVPVVLDIVGAFRDRFYEKALRQRSRRLGLDGAVAFRGNASATQLAGYYDRADVFVFASLCENAGSFAVFDALHRGLPTVCSNASSLPEIVGPGTMQSDVSDPTQFATSILRMIDSADVRSAYAKKATVHAALFPTWADRGQLLKAFCLELGHEVQS